jgi:hypothetical protein
VQSEADEVFAAATLAQKGWARTPLWKRAEMIHTAAKLMQVRREGFRVWVKGRRHLESRAKAAARWDLEVSAGWASPYSRGLWGCNAPLLAIGGTVVVPPLRVSVERHHRDPVPTCKSSEAPSPAKTRIGLGSATMRG